MDRKNIKPFMAAEYLTYGDLDKTALGDVISSLVSGDVKHIANMTDSIQIINSGISSALNLMMEAIEGRELAKEETTRLADALHLMSSLSQLCSNAACAADGAKFSFVGALCR